MRRETWFNMRHFFARAGLLLAMFAMAPSSHAAEHSGPTQGFPLALETYGDAGQTSLLAKLADRVAKDPFNLVATLIFFAAILHTFLAAKFRIVSHRLEHEYEVLGRQVEKGDHAAAPLRDKKKFLAVVFHFLGEVEAIFGIWLIPLTLAIMLMKGPDIALSYISNANFTEPIFVVVIMAIASSRPILFFSEKCLERVARVGGDTPWAWWVAILTVGPLLASFITEPAAMTICALLLVSKFYKFQPSLPLRYATLGLLFVNVSVGGTLTHFAAPPVVMVAGKWGWNLVFMFTHFGWKAAVGILISNSICFTVFRKELLSLRGGDGPIADRRPGVSGSVVAAHLLFIAAVVYAGHYAAVVILIFMLFLAFVMATEHNQQEINLRSPVFVGFFLAGLVIHGGCQQWWIDPVLRSLGPTSLLIGATILTSFNDNAAITYLASLVPGFSPEAKLAVMAGAVTGGGLTVIANAPNPAGQSILQDHFGIEGVSAVKLFLAALLPTVVMLLMFLFL